VSLPFELCFRILFPFVLHTFCNSKLSEVHRGQRAGQTNRTENFANARWFGIEQCGTAFLKKKQFAHDTTTTVAGAPRA
jgi:hypothetical protein